MRIREDLELISSWVKKNSKVLDLGCGDGSLLKMLKEQKNVTGYGIDYDISQIKLSLDNRINVMQLDLNDGLNDFKNDTFDYVVLAQSLQEIKNPEKLLKEMLRIGKEVIISFPNMGHWSSRLQLFIGGKMPVTSELPHAWHNTPNIHLCTIYDFENFCKENNFVISNSSITSRSFLGNLLVKILPNLFGQVALLEFSSLFMFSFNEI